ncbi:hypothetical protein ACFVFH_33510 [Streptomyces sp. NPDC057697]
MNEAPRAPARPAAAGPRTTGPSTGPSAETGAPRAVAPTVRR